MEVNCEDDEGNYVLDVKQGKHKRAENKARILMRKDYWV